MMMVGWGKTNVRCWVGAKLSMNGIGWTVEAVSVSAASETTRAESPKHFSSVPCLFDLKAARNDANDGKRTKRERGVEAAVNATTKSVKAAATATAHS